MTPEDQRWRDQVRREAIAAGNGEAVANYLAAQVGKPRDNRLPADMPRNGSRVGMLAPLTHADRLHRLCGLFGAEVLVPALRGAGLPLRHVAAVLIEATGTGRAISSAGMDRVRLHLFAHARTETPQ